MSFLAPSDLKTETTCHHYAVLYIMHKVVLNINSKISTFESPLQSRLCRNSRSTPELSRTSYRKHGVLSALWYSFHSCSGTVGVISCRRRDGLVFLEEMSYICVKEGEISLMCNGTRYDRYEVPLNYKDSKFWIYLGTYLGLVLFAGRMYELIPSEFQCATTVLVEGMLERKAI